MNPDTSLRTSARLPLKATLLLSALLSVASVPAARARIVYVRAGATGDGTSWDSPAGVLSPAIASAAPGDEVWVAAATYVTRITLRPGVGLYGGFAGTETDRSQRDWRRNPTILDGAGVGSVVTAPATLQGETVLDGFVIRNGFGVTVSNYPSGGGVYSEAPVLTIRNNVFMRNYALRGGAIYCAGKPVIENNRFIGNHADSGAAIYCLGWAAPTIRNNVIQGNAGYSALYSYGASPRVIGNSFVSNAGTAVMTYSSGTPEIVNNIVAYNERGITLDLSQTAAAFHHNAVYGNRSQVYSGPGTDLWQANNLTADPRLVSVDGGDVHLLPDSPLIGAGDATRTDAGDRDMDGEPRVQGAAVDIGADESDGSLRAWSPVILRVSPGGNDANDGLTWDGAKRHIQAAVDAATLRGGEVWVAAGTYTENVVQEPYVGLYGGFAGAETERSQRDAAAHVTDVDASQKGSAVRIYSGMTPAVLDGFTLRNGSGTTWYGGSQRNGGGLFALYTSAVISNNIIRDNTATVYGGGLIVSGWGVVIAGNTVANNKLTTPTPDVNSVGGGGMHVSGDGTIVRDNTVTGNEAGNAGGILLYNGTMTVTGNVISGNRAFTSAQGGGGVSAYYVKSTLLSGNVIRNNTAAGSGGGVRLTTPANLIIRNSLISGNSAANGGGVYQGVSVNVSISSSTVTGNIATGEGGGLYLTSAPIRDTIIAFNSSGVYTGSAASFSYNDVFGNTAYNYKGIPDMTGSLGNLMQDPQFEDAAAGDYHLQPTSPLIDAGTDIRDTPSERDLAGNLRRLGPRVDIGAYEFVPAGVFTLEDARRALALAAGFVVAEAGDARLNVVAPEDPAIDLLDAIRIARKAVGTDTNP